MLSNNIIYKNFRLKKKYSKEKKIIKNLKNLIKFPSQILVSMSTNYKDSYKKKLITKYKKFNNLWWKRRKDSFVYAHTITKKLIFLVNFDYLISSLINRTLSLLKS